MASSWCSHPVEERLGIFVALRRLGDRELCGLCGELLYLVEAVAEAGRERLHRRVSSTHSAGASTSGRSPASDQMR